MSPVKGTPATVFGGTPVMVKLARSPGSMVIASLSPVRLPSLAVIVTSASPATVSMKLSGEVPIPVVEKLIRSKAGICPVPAELNSIKWKSL
ncbi:hypothetical protein ES703_56699 [subsurface metagenome]